MMYRVDDCLNMLLTCFRKRMSDIYIYSPLLSEEAPAVISLNLFAQVGSCVESMSISRFFSPSSRSISCFRFLFCASRVSLSC